MRKNEQLGKSNSSSCSSNNIGKTTVKPSLASVLLLLLLEKACHCKLKPRALHRGWRGQFLFAIFIARQPTSKSPHQAACSLDPRLPVRLLVPCLCYTEHREEKNDCGVGPHNIGWPTLVIALFAAAKQRAPVVSIGSGPEPTAPS